MDGGTMHLLIAGPSTQNWSQKSIRRNPLQREQQKKKKKTTKKQRK